jgi:hypothetical protein
LPLNAHDKRALDMIEERLAASDTQLAAMLSTFSRLTDGEAIPACEQIQADKQRTADHAVRSVFPGRRPRPGLWIILTMWLITSSVLIAVALVLSHTGGSTACTDWPVAACLNHMPAHPRTGSGQRPR